LVAESILMKQAILLLLIVSAISCTKEKNPSLIGRWNIVESMDDVGQVAYNNSQNTFIKFNSNGRFEMDTVSNYFDYKQYLKDMNRYKIISDNKIKFYSANSQDSAIVGYTLDRQLLLGFGYVAEKFTK
jgi:hypothetical protein